MNEPNGYELCNALEDLYSNLGRREILLAGDICRDLVDCLFSVTFFPEVGDVVASQASSVGLVDQYYLPVRVLGDVPLLSRLERCRIEFYRNSVLCGF